MRARYQEPTMGFGSRWSAMGRLVAFAALVFTLEAVVFLAQLGRDVTPFALVLIPAAAALVVSAIGGGTTAVRRLVGRLGVWRVRPRWYAAAILIPVAEKVIVDLAGLLLSRTTPHLLVSAVTITAATVPVVVLVPGLLEELGWRGFAVQSALDGGRSVVWATLVVGLLFLLIHVPLYLPGHLYQGMPFWPLPVTLLSSSVLLTWIYLRTESVLLTGLMHAAFNGTVPLTWGLDPTWVWQARAVVLAVFAAVLVASQLYRRHSSEPGDGPRPRSLRPLLILAPDITGANARSGRKERRRLAKLARRGPDPSEESTGSAAASSVT